MSVCESVRVLPLFLAEGMVRRKQKHAEMQEHMIEHVHVLHVLHPARDQLTTLERRSKNKHLIIKLYRLIGLKNPIER